MLHNKTTLYIDKKLNSQIAQQIIVHTNAYENKNSISICVHKWIYDYIDISPELFKKICYCSKCEITKNE